MIYENSPNFQFPISPAEIPGYVEDKADFELGIRLAELDEAILMAIAEAAVLLTAADATVVRTSKHSK